MALGEEVPGDRELSESLLAYLRDELDNAGVRYRAAPALLSGGYETRRYRFQLDGAPEELSGPLVLRIFSAGQSAQRAAWETAVQNSLAEQGYLVPRIVLTGADTSVVGGPFVVMEFAPGGTLLEAEPSSTPHILGVQQAKLHDLDPEPLIHSLRARGIDESWFRYGERLDRLVAKREAYPWLADALQWLVDNKPPEPDRLSICHGDFHPLNILVAGGEVSAILDWSGFSIADPVMDVAFTDLIIWVAGRVVFPAGDVDLMLSGYRKAYESVRHLDTRHLDYYRTLRCVMALNEGAEGQDIWARPAVLSYLTEWIREGTGIRIVVPG